MKKYISILTIGLFAFLTACSQVAPPIPNYLIMLTETATGNTDATFISIDSHEACETRAAAARKVFPMAKVKYLAHYCAKTEAVFEPFLHNPEPTGPSYIFGLNFSNDGTMLEKITPYASEAECGKIKSNVCVVSYQNTQ